MNCKYCFRNKRNNNKINADWKKIIDWIISQNKFDEINIAGGEPTLAPYLVKMLKYCKQYNLKTSIITNGLILSQKKDLLDNIIQHVDCIGISVDSLNNDINTKIGRISNGEILNLIDIKNIYHCAKEHNKIFKINTVVSKLNLNDVSIYKMSNLKIDRFKLLKNNEGEYAISDDEFSSYCNQFKNNMKNIGEIIIETKMNDTYIKVTSDGTLDSNSKNKYNVFEDDNALEKALDDLDEKSYNKRYVINNRN